MLVSTIISEVRTLFGDAHGVQFDDNDAIRWCNDAQLDIVRKTECLYDQDTPTMVVGTYLYPLPSDFLKFKRVLINDRAISPLSAAHLDRINSTRSSSNFQGESKYYYREGNQIGLYPTPDTVLTFAIDYVPRPTTLALTSDALTIPEEYAENVKNFCLARAYELDDNFAQAERKMKVFEDKKLDDRDDQKNPQVDSYPSVRPVGDDWW